MERSLRCVALLALVLGMIQLSHACATRLPIQGAETMSPARKLQGKISPEVLDACYKAYITTYNAAVELANMGLKQCLVTAYEVAGLTNQLKAVKNCYDINSVAINAAYTTARNNLKACLAA